MKSSADNYRDCKANGRSLLQKGLPALKPRKVLLVDDDESVRETSADMLQELGYQVQQAENGFQALAMLEQTGFHVMVTDIRMPGMSGFELSNVARHRHRDLKIILMSGYYQPQLLSHRFLQKPFRTHDLDEAIRAELDPALSA